MFVYLYFSHVLCPAFNAWSQFLGANIGINSRIRKDFYTFFSFLGKKTAFYQSEDQYLGGLSAFFCFFKNICE